MTTRLCSRLRWLLLAAFLGISNVSEMIAAEPAPEAVRVMSFNLFHGGDGGKQPLDQTVAVIKESQADIVGLQETAGFAQKGGTWNDSPTQNLLCMQGVGCIVRNSRPAQIFSVGIISPIQFTSIDVALAAAKRSDLGPIRWPTSQRGAHRVSPS